MSNAASSPLIARQTVLAYALTNFDFDCGLDLIAILRPRLLLATTSSLIEIIHTLVTDPLCFNLVFVDSLQEGSYEGMDTKILNEGPQM